jgi:Thiol-disulfide isomerase and thioredoxins
MRSRLKHRKIIQGTGTVALSLCMLLCISCTFMKPSADSDIPSETESPFSSELNPAGEKTESEETRLFRFETTDLEGNPLDETIFDGYDLVMLNFWAYWCGPCVREIPELEQLHQLYPKLLLLGVIVDESDMEATADILKDAGATYQVVYPRGDLKNLADNCQYIPTTFFLKPNGMLLNKVIVGSNDLSQWQAIVEENLP